MGQSCLALDWGANLWQRRRAWTWVQHHELAQWLSHESWTTIGGCVPGTRARQERGFLDCGHEE